MPVPAVFDECRLEARLHPDNLGQVDIALELSLGCCLYVEIFKSVTVGRATTRVSSAWLASISIRLVVWFRELQLHPASTWRARPRALAGGQRDRVVKAGQSVCDRATPAAA